MTFAFIEQKTIQLYEIHTKHWIHIKIEHVHRLCVHYLCMGLCFGIEIILRRRKKMYSKQNRKFVTM